VRHFLHQCLQSVFRSEVNFDFEVIIVDNNSVDGSQLLITNEFPQVDYNYISENLGFGKANNIGIQKANGDYILLLNPDTVIAEETLQKCYDKISSDSSIGALGCKMVDGSGEFLKESKRGFPTVLSSFFKLSGMSRFFTRSAFFNSYNQGHIDEDQTAEVDVLCGAMMFIRADLLKNLKGFDPAFFMYGEDIDLSYRIKEAGKKIVYFPKTSIVHYKGESSKRNKLKYYKMFYEAMIIYVKKHFGNSGSSFLMLFFLKIAIYLRGGLGFLIEMTKKTIHPFTDALVIAGIFKGISYVWANYFYEDPNYYTNSSLHINILIYAILFVGGLFLMGNYDKRTGIKNILVGVFIGFLSILIVYAMIPLEYRSSRAIILLGSLVSIIYLFLSKSWFNYFETGRLSLKKPLGKEILIVSDKEECKEIESFLNKTVKDFKISGFVNPLPDKNTDPFFLNSIDYLGEVTQLYPVNEVIFGASSVPYKTIVQWMSTLGDRVFVKIASRGLLNIVGSDSSNKMGELYTVDLKYRINEAVYKRLKRIVDILFSIFAILLMPLRWILTSFNPEVFIQPLKVLINRSTWVAYDKSDPSSYQLPHLKKGIFNISNLLGKSEKSDREVKNLNDYYARNYNVMQDVEVFLKSLFKSDKG